MSCTYAIYVYTVVTSLHICVEIDMAERDRSAKFIELANKRVNRAISDIKLVGNLANRQNYEFTEDQAKKIIKALQQAVDQVRQSFNNTEDSARGEFKL